MYTALSFNHSFYQAKAGLWPARLARPGWQDRGAKIQFKRSFLGCSQHRVLCLWRLARIGCLTGGPNWPSWGSDDFFVSRETSIQVSDLRTLVSRYIPKFERWFSKLLIFIWIFPPLNFWVLSRFIQSFFQHMPSSDEKNMSWASSKYILCSQWPCTRWTHVTLSGMSYLGQPTIHILYDAHALHLTAPNYCTTSKGHHVWVWPGVQNIQQVKNEKT